MSNPLTCPVAPPPFSKNPSRSHLVSLFFNAGQSPPKSIDPLLCSLVPKHLDAPAPSLSLPPRSRSRGARPSFPSQDPAPPRSRLVAVNSPAVLLPSASASAAPSHADLLHLAPALDL